MFWLQRPISLIVGIRPWKAGQWAYFRQQIRRYSGSGRSGHKDMDHLSAAAAWLGRAQDAQANGGVSGRYLLGRGWTKAYPKTTGDLIPTFLALADVLDDRQFHQRAEACVHFLLPLQMPNGAYPAGEIGGGNITPSAFNTAQIISGLIAWYRHSGDGSCLQSAVRAADWLISIQDADGAWRQFFLGGIASTHDAYLACWLAKLGNLVNDPRYLEGARRNLSWILSHRVETTGWIDLAGYDRDQQQKRQALTHSIAYTLMGALRTALELGDADAVVRLRASALAPARLLADIGWLPAVLDWQWQPQTPHACLAGNAQMAELWLTLHEIEPDIALFDAARRTLNIVKCSQSLDNPNPDIRGGIPGSNPVWGEYIFMGLPNWAAKFFVDALLLERQKQAGSPNYRGTNG